MHQLTRIRHGRAELPCESLKIRESVLLCTERVNRENGILCEKPFRFDQAVDPRAARALDGPAAFSRNSRRSPGRSTAHWPRFNCHCLLQSFECPASDSTSAGDRHSIAVAGKVNRSFGHENSEHSPAQIFLCSNSSVGEEAHSPAYRTLGETLRVNRHITPSPNALGAPVQHPRMSSDRSKARNCAWAWMRPSSAPVWHNLPDIDQCRFSRVNPNSPQPVPIDPQLSLIAGGIEVEVRFVVPHLPS